LFLAGRVAHAAAHRRPLPDAAPTEVAPTAVRDRRSAYLLRDHFFLASRVAHAGMHRRPLTDMAATDVAPTAVCDRGGAHLLCSHFLLASRVAHAAALRRPFSDVSPTDACHCRRKHLRLARLCPASAWPESNGTRGGWR